MEAFWKCFLVSRNERGEPLDSRNYIVIQIDTLQCTSELQSSATSSSTELDKNTVKRQQNNKTKWLCIEIQDI